MRTSILPVRAAFLFAGALLAFCGRLDAQIAPPRELPSPPPVSTPPVMTPPSPAVAVRPGEILLNFQGADLQAVVKAIAQFTNRNILLDPRAKGQITIFSSRPMTAGAAYQVFLSAIKAQGFTAVDGPGDVVRIVPVAEAKLSAPVNAQSTPPGGGEQMVTQVAVAQHVPVTQLMAILRPLMSPTSQLAVYEPSNALIITDFADNVRRMLRILERIDLPASTDVTVIPLAHASAVDIADLVIRLSGSGTSAVSAVPGAPQMQMAAGGDRFMVVPDARTNSLLVRADNPGRVGQLRSLIEKLDVPARAGGATRVIYLKHAEAPKLAEILRGLLLAEARAATTGGAGVATAVPSAMRSTAAGGAQTSLVQADEATNAIIINAPDNIYNNLRGVIEKLDVRRAQIYVEALIVEMSTDKVNELGFQWAGARGAGNGAVGAVSNFPSANPGIVSAITSPTAAFVASPGLSIAMLGKTITLPDGTTTRSLGGLARALESANLANILSTPTLMTLDNAQAKIMVGQNVPFVTGSFAQAAAATTTGAAAVNPFQTIERKDVGLTLRIKPQISEGGTIRLEIYQEVSTVQPDSRSIASDLITNKRSIETKVVVDDGNTIVLGGLIEDTMQETSQGIPLLSRIPFLGALFRYKSEERKRTNLMVFLRPVIVRSPEEGYRVTLDRYDYLRLNTQFEGADREAIFNRLAPAAPGATPTPPSNAAPVPAPQPTPPPANAAPAAAPRTPEPAAPPSAGDSATPSQ